MAKAGEVELLAAVDLLKKISPEEREAVILALEHDYPGVGDGARAMLELEERKVVKLHVVEATKSVDVKVVSLGDGWSFVKKADGSKWRVKGTDQRRWTGPEPADAVVQLKAMEQAKPEPEPEPEEAKKPEAEPEAEPDKIEKPIRLDLEAPYDIARLFVRFNEDKQGNRRYVFVGKVEGELIKKATLCHWKDDFKCWNGQCYDDVDDGEIRAQVYDFLDQAVYPNNVRIKPRPKHVNEVIDGLKAGGNLVGDAPCWIEAIGKPEPRGLLVCKNGLLELDTGKLWDHDPRLFCLNRVDFEFDPKARAPRWNQFLREVWPRNEEAIAGLQEFFGLWLTDETKFQKGCGLIGDPRSGKGTIGRVAKGLLGSTSCVGISLQNLGEDFGMANLIGKKLAVVPDVKLDRRMNIMRIMERLLTTMGEDDQSINRKNEKYWQGKLTIRWLILGNDIPKFRGTDEAGALAARMIMIPLYESFYGREDFDLTTKLLEERAGILNWAMEGWRRLRDRGKFVQPASGMALVEKLKASTSTLGTFVLECCELGPNEKVMCEALWLAFCEWSERRGLSVTLSSNRFSAALHELFPSVVTTRPWQAGERPRWFGGIKLREGWNAWTW
jgi:putative DNA primase/helicase